MKPKVQLRIVEQVQEAVDLAERQDMSPPADRWSQPACPPEPPAPCPKDATLEEHAATFLAALKWMSDRGLRNKPKPTLWRRWKVRASILVHALDGKPGLSLIFDSLLVNTSVGRRAIWQAFLDGEMP